MCDQALEPPVPDGLAQLKAAVDGRDFPRLSPDGAYAPVTDELLERVLHGLRRSAE
jgi:hypothetical protein